MSKSFSILHVVPFFTPAMGGVPRIVYGLARRLSDNGHKVTVLTTDYQRSIRFQKENGIEIVDLHATFNSAGINFAPSTGAWLSKNIRRFDIVHLHTLRTYQNLNSIREATQARIPIVLSPHGTIPYLQKKIIGKRLYDLLFREKMVKSTDAWIAISRLEKSQITEVNVPPGRIRIIPNAIDRPELIEGENKEKDRKLGQKTIVFLGRIDKLKGIDFLLEACSKLDEKRNPWFVKIAGPDGGEKKSLQDFCVTKKINRRVHFLDPVYEVEKWNLLRNADVVVAPSRYEIFGLVPFEALVCGTPIIVSKHCGSCDIFAKVGCAYIVDPEDTISFAETIRRCLSDQDGNGEKVRKGQEWIRSHLDWSQIASSYEEVYTDCTEKRASLAAGTG